MENWSRKIFIIDSVLKANPWTYEIKDLNGKTLIETFYQEKLFVEYIINKLLSRTRQSIILEIMIKVVLDLSTLKKIRSCFRR